MSPVRMQQRGVESDEGGMRGAHQAQLDAATRPTNFSLIEASERKDGKCCRIVWLARYNRIQWVNSAHMPMFSWHGHIGR